MGRPLYTRFSIFYRISKKDEFLKKKDKKRIMMLIMNENCDAKLNRRIYDYLVCANTFKLSKKNLEEALENQEL